MYAGKNFKNKEDFEKTVAKGKKVTVFEPRWARKYTHQRVPINGLVHILGPWITKEVTKHDWQADAILKDGRVIEVR